MSNSKIVRNIVSGRSLVARSGRATQEAPLTRRTRKAGAPVTRTDSPLASKGVSKRTIRSRKRAAEPASVHVLRASAGYLEVAEMNKSKNNLADDLARTLDHFTKAGHWDSVLSIIRADRSWAKRLPRSAIHNWVDRAEEDGRYDIVGVLLQGLPIDQTLPEWAKRAQERTDWMYSEHPNVPADLRTAELCVIDSVRENSMSKLAETLTRFNEKQEDLIDLAEDVQSTLHLMKELARTHRSLSIDELASRTALSYFYVKYLTRNWMLAHPSQ